jgi:hypothetical protein
MQARAAPAAQPHVRRWQQTDPEIVVQIRRGDSCFHVAFAGLRLYRSPYS